MGKSARPKGIKGSKTPTGLPETDSNKAPMKFKQNKKKK